MDQIMHLLDERNQHRSRRGKHHCHPNSNVEPFSLELKHFKLNEKLYAMEELICIKMLTDVPLV